MRRTIPAVVLSVVVCAFAIAAISVLRRGSGPDVHEVHVTRGMSAGRVARLLVEKKVVSSPYPFLFWTRFRRANNKIQIGLYRFPSGRSAWWILSDMIKGKIEKARVAVPEGFASWQIAERLEATGVCDAEAFLQHVRENRLEGFLFPATYEIGERTDPTEVAALMVREFNERWTDETEERAKIFGWNKSEAVTLASIIEREVMDRSELPLVSAVYHNRLKNRMRLQADPTVQYAIGFWKPRLTYEDYTKTKSPYNTYRHGGLPPGPICSPGWDAVQAALWPADFPALYMLAQEDGRHTFSNTYREHTNKVNQRNRRKKQQSFLRPSPGRP